MAPRGTQTAAKDKTADETTEEHSGVTPDLATVQADASAAASEQEPQTEEESDEVDKLVAEAVPYAGPVEANALDEDELTDTQKDVQKFNNHVQTHPGYLSAQVGQIDTSGTAGRTDAQSIVAVSTTFSHPAAVAQVKAAHEAKDSESADAKLGKALREAVANG